MSFLSDLFEGNIGNLGTDITHAPQSFVQDISSEALPLGLTAAAVAAPFLLPELLPAAAGADVLGGDIAAGDVAAADIAAPAATDLSAGAADLTAADAAFGTFSPDVFAAETADVGAGLGTAETAAGTLDAIDPTLALAASDPSAAAFADPTALAASDTTAFAPPDPYILGGSTGSVSDITQAFGDPSAFTDSSGLLTQDIGGDTLALQTPTVDTTGLATATPAATDATDAGYSQELQDLTGAAPGSSLAGTKAAAAAAGAGGLFGTGVSGWQAAMLGLGAAPLALTLAKGQPQLPSSATALQQQGNALSAQGQADLAAAQAGQLNAGQTAQIGIMQQNLTNQWLQTMKNQGVLDPTRDSRWPQIVAQIDQQTTAATATFLQQNMQNALAETGQAASALGAIANLQVQQDQNFTNNLIGATKSLATVAALSGGAKPTINVGA